VDDLHARWMRDDPEYRAAHAASEDEFALASALIGARAHARLSQSALARRMGTSQAAIARLESGRYLPSARTLQRVAEATGTRLRISFSAPVRPHEKLAHALRRNPVSGLQSMVADQLVALLPSGEVRAAVVARRLDMSERSFTRRLAEEEGTTFAEILERVRQHLASGYLADDRKSIQQIARLLGYSNPGSFTHAYRRWTGISPEQARRERPSPALSP
jgi:AraC-like DNA-binding protein